MCPFLILCPWILYSQHLPWHQYGSKTLMLLWVTSHTRHISWYMMLFHCLLHQKESILTWVFFLICLYIKKDNNPKEKLYLPWSTSVWIFHFSNLKQLLIWNIKSSYFIILSSKISSFLFLSSVANGTHIKKWCITDLHDSAKDILHISAC